MQGIVYMPYYIVVELVYGDGREYGDQSLPVKLAGRIALYHLSPRRRTHRRRRRPPHHRHLAIAVSLPPPSPLVPQRSRTFGLLVCTDYLVCCSS